MKSPEKNNKIAIYIGKMDNMWMDNATKVQVRLIKTLIFVGYGRTATRAPRTAR